MSETRYNDYGHIENATDRNTQRSYITEPGVLFGSEMAVSSDGADLVIAIGAVLTEDGVIIHNNKVRTLDFTPQADATVFTIVQKQSYTESFGTAGSTYEVKEVKVAGTSIFATDEDDEVILGWLRYPGGSVDPSAYMIFNAPKLRTASALLGEKRDEPLLSAYNPLDYKAPFSDSPGCLLVAEDSYVTWAHTVDTDTLPITTVTNSNATTAKTFTLYLRPQRKTLYRPKQIDLDVKTDSAVTSIAVSTINDGTVVIEDTLTGALLDGVSEVVIDDQSIADAPLSSGKKWGIRLVVTLPALKTLVLRQVSVDAGPIPRSE